MTQGEKRRNIVLLFLSAALTILMCCLTTPQDATISAMQARIPVLGVAWGVTTALAVYFNMDYLRKKSGVDNLCFRIFLWVGSIAALLTPFTLGDSPIGFTVPFVNLHRLCAVLFAVVIYVAMITLLLARRKACGRLYALFVVVLAAVGGVNVYGMFALSSFISALMETCLILVGFTVLLLANYVVPKPAEAEKDSPKRAGRLTATAICVAVLVLLLYGISAIPSYRVQVSDEVVAARRVPDAGFSEVESEHFRIYLPDTWQERKYSDLVLYYDDVDRNSMSVTYEARKNFENISRFSVIQNPNVASARVMTYMEHPVLIVEKRERGVYSYSYLFNSGDVAVNVTLRFGSAEADLHETIFHSLLILDEA